MSSESNSPFANPIQSLRIKKGAPAIRRPTKEEITLFSKEAIELISKTRVMQESSLESGKYRLEQLEGKHFLLAGATGPGLGGSLALAALKLIKRSGSVTILSRDLKKSLGYKTGVLMQTYAEETGLENRFHWLNTGMALEGDGFNKIISALKEANANHLIYINTVASANSGLLPGYPPVFVKDADEEGLFQWQLSPLDERAIESTKLFMGTMAINFPNELEKAGIQVDVTAFADWRGSLDRISRDPNAVEYGRQGAYSTSLYLPKDILQQATSLAYGSNNIVLDIFLPVMRTRALSFIPGGVTMFSVYKKLMENAGVHCLEIPELALGVLNCIHKAINEGDKNPFPRLDTHDMPFDLWFYEVVKRLNEDENSDFYFKKWIDFE